MHSFREVCSGAPVALLVSMETQTPCLTCCCATADIAIHHGGIVSMDIACSTGYPLREQR